VLLVLSRFAAGSWAFLRSVYSFLLSVWDLTPNAGLWWYFFIEIFQDFRRFFLIVFQLQAVVFTTPILLKWK
ncbi:GPI transamidase subunit PIG-U, partial [Hyaloraphidium curvatum]